MTFDGQPDRKMSFFTRSITLPGKKLPRQPVLSVEKNFNSGLKILRDVILGSMRHQIMRVSSDFQIILSSSDFLAYLAWQPLLNLNPQNFSSFLSFVIKCIKTLKMQCSLKLEFFFIATSNSGLDSKQQIRDAGCLKK